MRTPAACEDLARHCTERERRVDSACFAAADRLKLRYLTALLKEDSAVFFEGIVARAREYNPIVYIPELGLSGELASARPARERGRRERGEERRQGSPGKTCKSGDVMYVQVGRVDLVKGSLELRAVQPQLSPKA